MAPENERGTAGAGEGAIQETETAQTQAGATAGSEGTQDAFFDPSELPDELKPTWKRMQGAYTKKMQGLAETRQLAEWAERLNSDPDFARQTILESASRLGLQVSEAGQAGQATPATSSVNAPPDVVQAIEGTLDPSLRWMAPMLASAVQTIVQKQVGPLQQRQEAEREQARTHEYQGLADDLSAAAPGWEEHEDEMTDLLNFIRSDEMRSRKWGSKLQLLHSFVTRDAGAIAEALERQRTAAISRTQTGGVSRPSAFNVEEKVMKAKNLRDAFAVAAQEATRELERGGHRFE